jgi:hypothetical protein
MKLHERPINEVLPLQDIKNLYQVIVGGMSWPSKEPGYGVLLGLGFDEGRQVPYSMVVAEYESNDIDDLIRQCCVMDIQWEPYQWIADMDRHEAAQEAIISIVRDIQKNNDLRWSGLKTCPPMYVEHKRPYEYILPNLKRMGKHKQLYLKDAKVQAKLDIVLAQDMAQFKWGAYPHIEALAFAALEIFRIYEGLKTRSRGYKRKAMYT